MKFCNNDVYNYPSGSIQQLLCEFYERINQNAEITNELIDLIKQAEGRGVPGPKGETGPKGDKGDRGPQGVAGPAGREGAQGPPGPQGSQGIPGLKGDRGEAGPQGPAGHDGAKGETGPRGPQGNPGAEGHMGPTGPQGPAGKDGKSINIKKELNSREDLEHVTPPLPQNGDAYLIKGDLWVYTGTQLVDETHFEGFTNVGHIQGPQGPMGPAGPTGPRGPEGAHGEPGTHGETGPRGPAGPQGPKGDKGEGAIDLKDYAKNADDYLKLGYIRTQHDTEGLPAEVVGTSRFGILFFLTDNSDLEIIDRGLQIYYCLDVHHKGKVYTRKFMGSHDVKKWTEWDFVMHYSELKEKVYQKDEWKITHEAKQNPGPLDNWWNKTEIVFPAVSNTGEKLKMITLKTQVNLYEPVELDFPDLKEIYNFQVTQDYQAGADDWAYITSWISLDHQLPNVLHIKTSKQHTKVQVMVIGPVSGR